MFSDSFKASFISNGYIFVSFMPNSSKKPSFSISLSISPLI
nr:MAG TPA: hypothetical protein [Caudoviricetes sp.]